MELLRLILFYAGLFAFFVTIHELGHYFAGRVAGIPAHAMKIRLLAFPQHVALKSGEAWLSPVKNIDAYIETVWRYLPTTPQVLKYVSGGFCLESVAAAATGLGCFAFGWSKIGEVVIWLSLFGTIFWVILDGLAAARGRVVGDLSGLWAISKKWAVTFLLFIIAVRAIPLWYIDFRK